MALQRSRRRVGVPIRWSRPAGWPMRWARCRARWRRRACSVTTLLPGYPAVHARPRRAARRRCDLPDLFGGAGARLTARSGRARLHGAGRAASLRPAGRPLCRARWRRMGRQRASASPPSGAPRPRWRRRCASTWCMRMTGRPGWRPPICASRRARMPAPLHHPQPGLPGKVPGLGLPAARPAGRRLRARGAGVLRRGRLPEGRAVVRRCASTPSRPAMPRRS